MGERRMLVAAVVTEVKDATVLYPGCHQCYAKMLFDLQDDRWWCLRCQQCCKAENLAWRYRLSLTVSDLASVRAVVIFGGTLQPHFGLPAKEFHRLLAANEKLVESLAETLGTIFEGQHFIFGFRHRGPLPLRSQAFTLADLGHGDADIIALQMLGADGAPPSITVHSVLQRLCLSPSQQISQLPQQQQQQEEGQQQQLGQQQQQKNRDGKLSARSDATMSRYSQTLLHNSENARCRKGMNMLSSVPHSHHFCASVDIQCLNSGAHPESSPLHNECVWNCASGEQSTQQCLLEHSKDATFLSILAVTYDFREGSVSSQPNSSGAPQSSQKTSSQTAATLVSSDKPKQLAGDGSHHDDEPDASLFLNEEDVLFLETSSQDIVGELESPDEDQISMDVDCASSHDRSQSPTKERSSLKGCFGPSSCEEIKRAEGLHEVLKECETRATNDFGSWAKGNVGIFPDSEEDDELSVYKRRSSCGPLLFLPSSPDPAAEPTAVAEKSRDQKMSSRSVGLPVRGQGKGKAAASSEEAENALTVKETMAGLCSKYLDMPESERLEDFLDKCFHSSIEESVNSYNCHGNTLAKLAAPPQNYGHTPRGVQGTNSSHSSTGRAVNSERAYTEGGHLPDVEVMLKSLDMPESEKMDDFLDKCHQPFPRQAEDLATVKLSCDTKPASPCCRLSSVSRKDLECTGGVSTSELSRNENEGGKIQTLTEIVPQPETAMMLKCLELPESEKFDDFLEKCFQSSFNESVEIESQHRLVKSVRDVEEIPKDVQKQTVTVMADEPMMSKSTSASAATLQRSYAVELVPAPRAAFECVRNREECSQTSQNLESEPLFSESSLFTEESVLLASENHEAETAESFLASSKRNAEDIFAPTAVKIRRCISSQMPSHSSREKEKGTTSPSLPSRPRLHGDPEMCWVNKTGTDRQSDRTGAGKWRSGFDDSGLEPAVLFDGTSQDDLFGTQQSQNCCDFDGSVDLFDSSSVCGNNESSPAVDMSVRTPRCSFGHNSGSLLTPVSLHSRRKPNAVGAKQHKENAAAFEKLESSSHWHCDDTRSVPSSVMCEGRLASSSGLKMLGPGQGEAGTFASRRTSMQEAVNELGTCREGLHSTPVLSSGEQKLSPCVSALSTSFLPSQDLFSPCDKGTQPSERTPCSFLIPRTELPPLCNVGANLSTRRRPSSTDCQGVQRSSISDGHLCLSHVATPKFAHARFCGEKGMNESPSLFSQSDLFSSLSSPNPPACRSVDMPPRVVAESGTPSGERADFVTPSRMPLSVHRTSNQGREKDFVTPKMLFSRHIAHPRVDLSLNIAGPVTPDLSHDRDDAKKELSGLLQSMKENLLLTSTPSHRVAASEESVFSPDLF